LAASATAPAEGGARVGIVAIQGDFEAHAAALRRLGATVARIRTPADLEGLDAAILPGGESTTISKGLERVGLYEPLEAFGRARPILGTCAGAVLMAREVENHPVRCLRLIDVVAVRNAYGTQVDSFAVEADLEGGSRLRCVFIRAPRLRSPGAGVEVLARVDGWPVFVRQGLALATTFHPELTRDTRVHEALLDLVAHPVAAMGLGAA